MKHEISHVLCWGLASLPLSLYSYEAEFPTMQDDEVITYITRGDLSPANAAYTINRPGVYKLTRAKTASSVPNISITANNVMLDLGGNFLTGGTNGIHIFGNSVTVKNGVVSGMTQSCVLV